MTEEERLWTYETHTQTPEALFFCEFCFSVKKTKREKRCWRGGKKGVGKVKKGGESEKKIPRRGVGGGWEKGGKRVDKVLYKVKTKG